METSQQLIHKDKGTLTEVSVHSSTGLVITEQLRGQLDTAISRNLFECFHVGTL